MIDTKVDADRVRYIIEEMRLVDKTILSDLRKEMRTRINPLARQVADEVEKAPLSGFINNGATAWAPSDAKLSFTPGRSRRRGDHLVSIRVTPKGGKRGLYIAELAGSRSAGNSNRGRALIRELNKVKQMKGKGGRFAYTKFRSLRPDAVDIAITALRNSAKRINRRLGV